MRELTTLEKARAWDILKESVKESIKKDTDFSSILLSIIFECEKGIIDNA